MGRGMCITDTYLQAGYGTKYSYYPKLRGQYYAETVNICEQQ